MREFQYFLADARHYICDRVLHGRWRSITNRLRPAAKRFDARAALTGPREFDLGHARSDIFILRWLHKGKEKGERAALA